MSFSAPESRCYAYLLPLALVALVAIPTACGPADSETAPGAKTASRDPALVLLDSVPVIMERADVPGLQLAYGENDDAFRWLVHEPPHAWVPWAVVDPLFPIPRDDPRFQEFLDRLKLPWQPE